MGSYHNQHLFMNFNCPIIIKMEHGNHQHSVQVAADDHRGPAGDLFQHILLSLKMFSETILPVSHSRLGILAAHSSLTRR